MKTLLSKNSKILWWLLKRKSEVTQSCPTPCDPMDCNLPGSSVHEIFKARVLEWVASSFSRGSSWPRDWTHVSCTERRMDSLPLGLPGKPNTESNAIGAMRNNTLLSFIPSSKSIYSAQKWKIWTLNKARQVKGHKSSEDEGPLRLEAPWNSWRMDGEKRWEVRELFKQERL